MIIAFGGAPNAGVTISAFKAAQVLYEKCLQRVLFISLDEIVPALRVLKIDEKPEKLPGLEDLLESDVISRESIIRHILVERKRPNFGILANKHAGHEGKILISKQEAQAFLKGITGVAQHIIVDCGRCDSYFSKLLWDKADYRITVVNASVKSKVLYRDLNPEYNSQAVWVVALEPRDKKNLEEVRRRFFKEKVHTLGYCGAIKVQEEKGELLEWLKGSAYKRSVEKALDEVLS